MEIDPITLEVIRNRLGSIVREMGDVTLRTARSSVVYSGRDFSCALLNSHGELLAIGTSSPIHIFPIAWHARRIFERFAGDVRHGDIFIGNEPYDGGTHLNDVLVMRPMFSDNVLVGFAANRAHWYDVGGMVPGSLSGAAREIYQEGLRIPPIRIGADDVLNEDIVELIFRNVRAPEESKGDLMAQVASCRLGEERVRDVLERYEVDETLEYFDEILETSERRMRMRISSLEDCCLVHEGYMDNDGVGMNCLRIRVTVRIVGDEVYVDYTGTSEQCDGPLNVGEAMAHCFALMGVRAALDPSGPVDAGSFRPMHVTAPRGSMLNANPPAATGGMAELGQAAVYTMVAFARVAAAQVSAEEGAAANHQTCAGVDTRSGDPRPFIYYDYPAGGGAGRQEKDGLEFVRTIRSGNINIQSIEVLEHRFPIEFLRHELREDSGGPGRYRGGMGVVREYRTPSNGTLSILGDHAFVAPGGLFHGCSGAPAVWEVIRDGESIIVSPDFGAKVAGFELRAGDVIRVATQGGGGYGDPEERDPARVRNDVIDGKVSFAQARKAYGVILDARTNELLHEQTEARRQSLRDKRTYFAPTRGGAPVWERGMRTVWLSPTRVNFRKGQMIEAFISGFPTLFRFCACPRSDLSQNVLLIDDEIWGMLSLSGEEQVLVRIDDENLRVDLNEPAFAGAADRAQGDLTGRGAASGRGMIEQREDDSAV